MDDYIGLMLALFIGFMVLGAYTVIIRAAVTAPAKVRSEMEFNKIKQSYGILVESSSQPGTRTYNEEEQQAQPEGSATGVC